MLIVTSERNLKRFCLIRRDNMWIFPISFVFRTTLYSFNSLGWRIGSERCGEVQAVGRRRWRGNESSGDFDEVDMMGK